MTTEEARILCNLIPYSAYTRETGMGKTCDQSYAAMLKAHFPEHNWRIILDRTGERSRWRLTIVDDDLREHRFDRLGGNCVHCGKTALELSVGEEEDGDEAIAVTANTTP